jgi:hypothetical protein
MHSLTFSPSGTTPNKRLPNELEKSNKFTPEDLSDFINDLDSPSTCNSSSKDLKKCTKYHEGKKGNSLHPAIKTLPNAKSISPDRSLCSIEENGREANVNNRGKLDYGGENGVFTDEKRHRQPTDTRQRNIGDHGNRDEKGMQPSSDSCIGVSPRPESARSEYYTSSNVRTPVTEITVFSRPSVDNSTSPDCYGSVQLNSASPSDQDMLALTVNDDYSLSSQCGSDVFNALEKIENSMKNVDEAIIIQKDASVACAASPYDSSYKSNIERDDTKGNTPGSHNDVCNKFQTKLGEIMNVDTLKRCQINFEEQHDDRPSCDVSFGDSNAILSQIAKQDSMWLSDVDISCVITEEKISNAFGFDIEHTEISLEKELNASSNVVSEESKSTTLSTLPSRRSKLPNESSCHESLLEVDPSLYAPQHYHDRPPPIEYVYNVNTRPVSLRRVIKVAEVFTKPICDLWKSRFDTFNLLQSEMTNTTAYSDDNIVVSAPTGAGKCTFNKTYGLALLISTCFCKGKTALFEMAMARFFDTDIRSPEFHNSHQICKARKVVYVAPSKALCEERFRDWSKRFMDLNLGLEVALITGDGDPSDAYRDLSNAHIIITTPEKWDSLTRRWAENFYLFGSVKLLLLDEIHLIADESRGCCLESIICRMKIIQYAAQNLRASQSVISRSRYVLNMNGTATTELN